MDFFRNETDFLQWVKTIFIERHKWRARPGEIEEFPSKEGFPLKSIPPKVPDWERPFLRENRRCHDLKFLGCSSRQDISAGCFAIPACGQPAERKGIAAAPSSG